MRACSFAAAQSNASARTLSRTDAGGSTTLGDTLGLALEAPETRALLSPPKPAAAAAAAPREVPEYDVFAWLA